MRDFALYTAITQHTDEININLLGAIRLVSEMFEK
jgi:hypothetical protein